jgi:hypothetical protein
MEYGQVYEIDKSLGGGTREFTDESMTTIIWKVSYGNIFMPADEDRIQETLEYGTLIED